MIASTILAFFATMSKFEVLKFLFFSLIGLTITITSSLYIALCPTLNTGGTITVPVFWENARFQLFGALAVILGWIIFWLYLFFGFKVTFWCVIIFLLFLALHFALQKLANYVKRKFSEQNNDLNI